MHSKFQYDDPSSSRFSSSPTSVRTKTPAANKSRSRCACIVTKKTRHGLVALSIVVFLFALLAWYYVTHHGHMSPVSVGAMHFVPKSRMVYLKDINGTPLFKDKLGDSLPVGSDFAHCLNGDARTEAICVYWLNTTIQDESPIVRMTIDYNIHPDNIQCIDIEWTAQRLSYSPKDCISLNNSHWYGGSEVYTQRWPIETASVPMQPYVSGDITRKTNVYGSVIERYWLSSSGIAVIVDGETPLHVSVNEKTSHELCFKAEYYKSPYQNPTNRYPSLKYTVCKGENIRTVHDYILQSYFKRPPGWPDERMFRDPIWSTWVRHRLHINQSSVLAYAREIDRHGFSNSQLEIDGMYTSHYGEVDFAATKFPNAKKMIQDLHDMKFRVTAWAHPFANIDSPAFRRGTAHKYWLREPRGRVPALVEWWNGVAATLDVTNEAAADWYVDKLREMQTAYGIDSFNFDAGEAAYLPLNYNATIPFDNPNTYCTRYVELVSQLNRQIAVRCAHQTQRHPIFVRMMDKDFTWNYNNGLLTLIPTALVMGIVGYPYILPDTIGGNSYADVSLDRELYIRWMEVTAYLPAVQFSVAPWQYDEETTQIAQEMVRIHKEVVTPMVLNLSIEVILKGHPIIRPLWWIAPNDRIAQAIDTQFLIGNAFLVAPVLTKYATSRDIYLPAGRWREGLRDLSVFEGGRWLREYPVGLNEVATFTEFTNV